MTSTSEARRDRSPTSSVNSTEHLNRTSVSAFTTICLVVPFVSCGVIGPTLSKNSHFSLDQDNLNMTAPVVISASAKHTATLIFLHGLGDTGHGWASAIGAIKAPFVKVICPTAHKMPVSLNQGFMMPSWFDLKALDINGPEDTEGIKRASELVHSMIESEIKDGIASDRIVIGGFSQGGALALYSALTYPKPLAGVVAMSCWLPLNKSFPGAIKGNKDTPILQCHGDCDPLVHYKWGQMTASLLKSFAKNVEFKTYTGLSHSSSEEEMNDIKTFLQKALPSQ